MSEEERQGLLHNLQGVAFIAMPIFIGIIFNMLFSVLVICVVIIILNILAEKYNIKQHAHSTFACWIIAHMLFFSCMIIARISEAIVPQWEAVLLGAVIAGVTTASASKMFHNKPKNENIETKKILRDELAKMSKSQAKEYLYERLPEDEAECLFWLDWQCKTLDFVAFHKIDVSVATLKELRSSAYKRIRHIHPEIDA